ncbi:Wadjet anti-phage system protein JetD domain-containing protein [Streptomyces lydicus]|uniref:Wadjet anti-phage system protein JetD domain-containing protein n=1 Tax=Streptomyces lydicus TaxID=47763 RepID=UPI003792ACEC
MAATNSSDWTTPRDVVARLRKRWERGDYLAELANGTDWEPFSIPLRGPKAGDITQHYEAALAWARSWAPEVHKHVRIEHRRLGGRLAGVNDVPARVWIERREDLWRLLGVTSTVHRYELLLACAREALPRLATWMADHPMRVVRWEADWPRLQATIRWINGYHGPAVYLRQLDVPGVDTKFIEHHRAILTTLLEHCLPSDRIDTEAARTDFAARFRFLRKPAYLRFRLLGDESLAGFSELTVRADEFTSPPSGITTVYVVENETTYLAFPNQPRSIVILGGGYAVTQLSALSWLHHRSLIYWGDLDTHGFAILDRLRRAFPHTQSILMTRNVLLEHRNQWVKEDAPTHGHLATLSPEEADLHESLMEGEFGHNVRLEQERVRYHLLEGALNDLHPESRNPTAGTADAEQGEEVCRIVTVQSD